MAAEKSTQFCTQSKRAAAAFIALAVLSSPVAAQSVCADHADVVNALKGRPHEEQKQWWGFSAAETLYELWSRPGGGWSIIVKLSNGTTCIVASGDQWLKPEKESH